MSRQKETLQERLQARIDKHRDPRGNICLGTYNHWDSALDLEAIGSLDAAQAEIARLKAIVRVNGLRWGHTHADIDALIGADPSASDDFRQPEAAPEGWRPNWKWDHSVAGQPEKVWHYDRGELLLGKISLGQYSRWSDISLGRDGIDPKKPIHAWLSHASFVGGVYQYAPSAWFATAEEAKAFVEEGALKTLSDAGMLLVSPRELASASAPTPASAGASEADLREWPHDIPNGWNLKADKFVSLVASCPHMWLVLTEAKYLELRIDTRDCGFNLYDRDRKPLHPDKVMAAIKDAKTKYGEGPYRKSTPAPASAQDLAKLTSAEMNLLSWLSMADSSAYGECKGVDLDRLIELKLASVEERGDRDYSRVSLTEAGWAAVSATGGAK